MKFKSSSGKFNGAIWHCSETKKKKAFGDIIGLRTTSIIFMTIWCAVIVQSHNYLKNKNKVADFCAIKLGYSPHSEGNFMTLVSSQFSGVALIPHGVTALVTLATLVPAGHRSSLLSAAPNKPANDSCFRSPPVLAESRWPFPLKVDTIVFTLQSFIVFLPQ